MECYHLPLTELHKKAFPLGSSVTALATLSAPPFELSGMSPVKYQDVLGTCTSFAVAACAEYYNPRKVLSEADFTVYAERHGDGGDCKPGLASGPAIQTAINRGFEVVPFV